MIDDPRKWRISKSGYTIRTGWGDEKKFIAAYPHQQPIKSGKDFSEWIENAGRIVDLYNDSLDDLVKEGE